MKERLVYFTYNGSALINETVLIEGIQGNSTHNGSRLLFAPDGKLLMTTGDAQNLAAPQDLDHLSGKILRINDDGSIPADNPFPDSYVYTFGHRNAQGLAFSPQGVLYSSEHGPANDDEINIIEAGRNYGWPDVEGYCNTPDEITFCEQHNVREPITAWTPTIATSDIIYYNNSAIPEWKGSILLVLLKNKQVIELELSDDGMAISSQKQYFTDFWGRLRDVCLGPNGEIYLATNGSSWLNNEPFTHSIVKLVPPAASGDASPGNAISPDRVTLTQFANQLRISSPEGLLDTSWSIIDMRGQVLESGSIRSEETLIAHQLESGFYLLKVGSENKNAQVHKIFVH
jgi:glucose/arabinose dehydrogenase